MLPAHFSCFAQQTKINFSASQGKVWDRWLVGGLPGDGRGWDGGKYFIISYQCSAGFIQLFWRWTTRNTSPPCLTTLCWWCCSRMTSGPPRARHTRNSNFSSKTNDNRSLSSGSGTFRRTTTKYRSNAGLDSQSGICDSVESQCDSALRTQPCCKVEKLQLKFLDEFDHSKLL